MASLPPRDVDSQVFNDFCCRRYALIEALTTEKGVLCLSANAAKMSWDVTCPPPELDMTPPELPQPAPGVFFKREGKPVSYKQEAMPLSEWLLKIAIQCDTWLKSVASHRGAHWDTSARASLITRINKFPTVVDAVKKHLRRIFGWNDESENNEEHKACGSCAGSRESEFWIKCDRCGTLYHGDCMQITPKMEKKIGKYRCPYCGPRE